MKLKSSHCILLCILFIFIISYIVTSYNYDCRNVHSDFVFLSSIDKNRLIYREWMNFRKYYENVIKIENIDIETEESKSLSGDCYNKNFSKWKYENNSFEKIKPKEENIKILLENKMKQENGIIKMINTYTDNCNISKELRGKFRVINDFFCPSSGVKEWSYINENGYRAFFVKPQKGNSWINYIDTEKNTLHRMKINKEEIIIFNLKNNHLPFWYSFDSAQGGGVRVLEVALTYDIAKELIPEKKE